MMDMTATAVSAAHQARRTEAAIRIADHLAAAGIDATTAAWLPDERRAAIAQAAGMRRAPEAETWAQACRLLQAAEADRAACPDVFAGLA
jgi:hypothetical protein